MPDYPTNALQTYENRANKGQPGGYAALDASGKIPAAQLGITVTTALPAGAATGPVLGVDVLTTGGAQSKTGPLVLLGGFATGQSAAAATLGTNGTINSSGIGVARVAPSTPVSEVGLAQGSFTNPWLLVLNESNNTITFGPAGSSGVANGRACQIAGQTACLFVWDTATGLWYSSPR